MAHTHAHIIQRRGRERCAARVRGSAGERQKHLRLRKIYEHEENCRGGGDVGGSVRRWWWWRKRSSENDDDGNRGSSPSSSSHARALVAAVTSSAVLFLCTTGNALAADQGVLVEKLEALQQQQLRQQREIDALVQEIRGTQEGGRGGGVSVTTVDGVERVSTQPQTNSAETMTLDDSAIDIPRLIIGLALTLGGTVSGILALENSDVLPAVKAANAASRRLRDGARDESDEDEMDTPAQDISAGKTDSDDDGDGDGLDAVVAGLRMAREEIADNNSNKEGMRSTSTAMKTSTTSEVGSKS